MPSYDHMCSNKECNFEWEDIYSIKKDPPTTCPKCLKETAVRLISGGSGRGVVELTGQDLVDKIKADTKQLKKDMHQNANVYANMLGESKYDNLQQRIDNNKRNK